ncbi:unnamed protein product [Penicillium palitans]
MAQLKPLVVWRRSGAWTFTALANLNAPRVWLLCQAANSSFWEGLIGAHGCGDIMGHAGWPLMYQ